jgi:universal stress protein A
MSFRKILCPVDFSEATAAAARYAAAWARRDHAALTLLHVAPPIDFGYSLAAPESSRMAEFAAHRNETVRQALELFPGGPALGYPAERCVTMGDPAEQILRLAKTDGYDLILLPTHGAGAIKRWLLLGSVTTKVLHAAECAVLAATDFSVPAGAPAPRHIVCALDLSANSRRVLCAAAGLARETGADLTAVHALPGPGQDLAEYFDEAWRGTLQSRAAQSLARLLEETGAAGQVVVEAGPPEKVVSEAAARAGADLILAGRATSNGMLGRLRAHTYEIIRRSPCPVLSV